MTRSRANALLLMVAACWGLAFVAQSTAMDAIGPYLFIALRFVVGSAVVLPFAIIELRREDAMALGKRELSLFTLIGVVFFGGMAFQQVGLLTTTVTNSGFLTALYVLFTPILGIVLFAQRPHPVVWPAIAIALVGIYLLSGGDLSELNQGDVLTVICAVFWALQIVLVGRFVGTTNRPIALALMQFVVCAMLAAVASALAGEAFSWPAIKAAGGEILFAGTLASGLAFTLQIVAQRHTTAPQAAIFLSAESFFAALFGALLLREWIGPVGLLGCGAIFVALLLAEIGPAAFPRPAFESERRT